MCSINGFNFEEDALIQKMNVITAHRGRDGQGVYVGKGISLGHNRLSIIDVDKRSDQPMKNNAGDKVIVFNGEIYNYRELKKELSGSYQFHTESDTEVILAAYEKWGHGAIKKLSGIFAFAIWDETNGELILARDHVGVKPLYYYLDGDQIIFSSEIKAILEHPVPRVLDMEAFNHYLRVLYTPEPHTMFKGIHKFPPASYAVYKKGKLQINKYWEVEFSDSHRSKKEIETDIKKKITDIIERQLVSDKPVGVYLSGGIDSSVILDRVSSLRSGIETFSVGFDLSKEEQSERFNADFNLAKRTADFYGAHHNEVVLDINDVVDNFEKTVWHLDEPISNPTMMSMMKLAHFAKEKVDVVLGGDGGDELFGGYPRYKYNRILDTYQMFTPSFVRNILSRNLRFEKLNTKQGIDRMVRFMFQKDEILCRVVNNDFLDPPITNKFFEYKYFSNISSKQFINNFMNTDRRTWLVDYSLMLTDKITMSAALEERVPLLDKELVEYAATISDKYKVNIFDTKMILKEAFKNDLPEFVLSQPKRGWISPGAKWLRQEKMYNMTKNILTSDYYEGTKDLFNWDAVRTILDDHCEQKQYNLTIIWALLTFQVWARKYKIKIN